MILYKIISIHFLQCFSSMREVAVRSRLEADPPWWPCFPRGNVLVIPAHTPVCHMQCGFNCKAWKWRRKNRIPFLKINIQINSRGTIWGCFGQLYNALIYTLFYLDVLSDDWLILHWSVLMGTIAYPKSLLEIHLW